MVDSVSVRLKKRACRKNAFKHSYAVECGNRLRVGVRAKNASVSAVLRKISSPGFRGSRGFLKILVFFMPEPPQSEVQVTNVFACGKERGEVFGDKFES